jgi:hypothetical protein
MGSSTSIRRRGHKTKSERAILHAALSVTYLSFMPGLLHFLFARSNQEACQARGDFTPNVNVVKDNRSEELASALCAVAFISYLLPRC